MVCSSGYFIFVFFKQKTAYEMRISDWSSDVCSSDLHGVQTRDVALDRTDAAVALELAGGRLEAQVEQLFLGLAQLLHETGVFERVELAGSERLGADRHYASPSSRLMMRAFRGSLWMARVSASRASSSLTPATSKRTRPGLTLATHHSGEPLPEPMRVSAGFLVSGRSGWAPVIFGCQAPDTGNAEIIAHYGTPEQKERYLRPLLEGEIFSCYSMTEPHAGSDPTMFTTRAERDGDEWVINGWKFFSSNANTASFLIVMVVTNTDVSAYNEIGRAH